MCGIVAATSEKEDIFPFLWDGLIRLEYRGYDSHGLAVYNYGGSLFTHRRVGSASRTEKPGLWGVTGIGHTRWATHGNPSVKNCHPIIGGLAGEVDVHVVHNGVIVNFEEEKKFLYEKGYEFYTDTDTEVLAHLLDYYSTPSGSYEPTPMALIGCVVGRLKGDMAFAAILSKWPHMVLAYCRNLPLVFTMDGKLASDPLVFAGKTSCRRLHSGMGLILQIGKVAVFDPEKACEADMFTHSTAESVPDDIPGDPSPYKHWFLKEVYEQPRTITKNYSVDKKTGELSLLYPERVYLYGCGSSLNAAHMGKFFFEEIVGLPAHVELASERNLVEERRVLHIALTQSGETRDVLAALREVPARLSLVVTNNPSSQAASLANYVLPLECGHELSVAATKTFTAQVMALFDLAHYLHSRFDHWDKISQLKSAVNQVLDMDIQPIDIFLDCDGPVFIIGRRGCLAAAREIALKLKEVALVNAEAVPLEELKHGPLSLVLNNICIFLVQNGQGITAIREVLSRGGVVFVVTDPATASDVEQLGVRHVVLPMADKLLWPLLPVIYFQKAAYQLAIKKKLNPDRPIALAKSVTVE